MPSFDNFSNYGCGLKFPIPSSGENQILYKIFWKF